MKARVPMMVDDARFAPLGRPEAIEGFDVTGEDFFLDGPVTRRVAVLDFDDKTGALHPGARFVPPAPGNVLGRYDLPKEPDITSRAFSQVSVFATVLKTIYMYEEADTLGRRIRWAFHAPQLLVIPRAGRWDNAFYERDSHSLQFFYFQSPKNPSELIYTSLARDIVAHETGHAILDGIAPHLWDAITPQALALHEAVGDLTALLVSLRSGKLKEAVLERTGGSIENATHFSAIAEDFGLARGSGALRSLLNETTLNDVDRSQPYALCVVLTGALYKVLVKMHEARKKLYAARLNRSEYSVSGKALVDAAQHFKRMTLRALDYLPPGEVSFADYGRAIIAADQASHPKEAQERDWISDEFVRRGLVGDRAALQPVPPAGDLKGLDLGTLTRSDWAAYDFANSRRGRQLLGIPANTPFQVEPRLQVNKLFCHRDEAGTLVEETVRECLFKVSWTQEEHGRPPASGYPAKRRITVGTTLAWDRDRGEIRVLLTSDHTRRPAEQAQQHDDRDRILQRLADEGVLRLGRQALGPDGRPLRSTVAAEDTEGRLRVRGAARLLHIAGEV